MPDTGDTNLPDPKLTKHRPRWWAWIIGDVKRKLHERRVKMKHESAADRAARRTVFSTGLIAVFTIALACVGYLQYQEIRDSGIESSVQMDQMIHQYRSQVAQLKRQAGDTHDLAVQTKDLADRMKDQADRTKTIAEQAVVQANSAKLSAQAAKRAADIADQTLHISERAYVVAGVPEFDFPAKTIRLPIINNGHIPSGKVTIRLLESTYRLENPDINGILLDAVLIESHQKDGEVQYLAQGGGYSINITIPDVIEDKIKTGYQAVRFSGVISYNNGFPSTPLQTWEFCTRSYYVVPTNQLSLAPCDPTSDAQNPISTPK